MWPLARILAVQPAWGGTCWDQVVAAAMDDPADARVVEVLAEALDRQGQFREPVRVDVDEVSGVERIGNGMHRVVAHIVACNDQVKVTRSEPEIVAAWYVRLLLPAQFVDEAFEVVSGLSLPVDDETWLEKCGCDLFGLELGIDLIANRSLPDRQVAEIVAGHFVERGIPVRSGLVAVERPWWLDVV